VSSSTVIQLALTGGAEQVLATNQPISGIAVDSNNVYFAGNDSVRYSPIGASSPPVTLEGGNSPNSVTVDANNVYWTDATGAVQFAPISGGGATTLAMTQATPTALALQGGYLYWAVGVLPMNGAIMKMPVTGGTPVVLAGIYDYPLGMVVDATSVYWVTQGGSVMSTPR
jgi:hypothetical protein